jgi:hypothetical protein
MQEKSGEKLNIFSFSATSFIAMDRYESVDLFQAPVNSNMKSRPLLFTEKCAEKNLFFPILSPCACPLEPL